MSEQIKKAATAEAVHTRAAKGGLVSGVGFAVNLGLNLMQVPLLLRFWPQDTYGLWLSVAALATLLTSLDGGHQAYVGNLLSRRFVEDRALFQRTLSSAVCVAAMTATVQITLALLLCFSGRAAGWLGIESGQSIEFSLAVLIYTVGWISTGSVGAILVRLFPPTGNFVRSTWWAIGMRLSQFLAVAVAAWLEWGLVGTTWLFAGTVFAVNMLLFADIRRLYPEFFPWWKGVHWKEGFTNLGRSGVITVVGLLDYFSLQGVVLMVAGGLGTAVVPLFTTLRTMANMAMQGTSFLLNPIQPDLVRYHVQREGSKIGAVFAFFWFATGLLINGGLVVGLLLVEPVYAFWTQGKLPFDRALFTWLAAGVLLRTLAAPLQSYLTSINGLRALLVSAAVRGAMTVGGVALLAPRWGLPGVGAALFAAELAGSLALPTWFTASEFSRLETRFTYRTFGWASVSTLAAGVAMAGFAVGGSAWPWLVAGALVVQAAVAGFQWRELPPDVKRRVGSLLAIFNRRTAGASPAVAVPQRTS
jgi:O-antigen/teichoic acid export membrane protein